MTDIHKKTIHLVGHAHIDPTWLWRWTEGYEEVRATFRSALERMNETPEFKFSATSACFYAWIQACEPAMFEQIRQRVREGRWEIAGGWWVEPDCNLPGGESFVRQGLYAQRFFQREFGRKAVAGFNPDSFGHAGTLPQLLKGVGLRYYVYMRPMAGVEMDYPGGTTFRWLANDGTEILACNLLESYNEHEPVAERAARLARNPQLNPGQRQVLGFYGVGNHGGGPTKRTIAQILDLKENEPSGERVRFSTLQEYFEAFESDVEPREIPVIDTDLQHHARGCYSVHSEIKRLNRQCEHALMAAERFASAAWLLEDRPWPGAELEQAWKGLLYNQFHDILAGTSIASSYEDSRDELGGVRHSARRIANESIQLLAARIDTSAEGNTVVVINPLPWPVTQTVVVQPIVARALEGPIHFVDYTEEPVPSQAAPSERPGSTCHVFTAELPSLGYRCFHARSGARPHRHENMLDAGERFLENEWWRIELDGQTGQISRLYDKRHKTDVLKRGGILSCLTDSSDTWSHDVKEYRVEAGAFGQGSLHLHEFGDVRATIMARLRWDRSEAVQLITLHREIDTIDCEYRINWQQQYMALKLAYETRVMDGRATCDTAYGVQERPVDGAEQPCQRWVDVTGDIGGREYGLAILNDSKNAFDVLGSRHNMGGLEGARAPEGAIVRLTLLRSPAYAHHEPARYMARDAHPVIDQKWQTVRIQLVPHAGPATAARVVKRAWELNEPALAHIESAHEGKRPGNASFIGTEAENVLLSVLKKAEDGDDLIVRGYETDGVGVETTLHLPYWDKTFQVRFAAHEIKTIRINPRDWTLREANLLEE